MKNLKIVIAGGNGFIGRAMARRWAGDNQVTVLTRGTGDSNNSYGTQHSGNVLQAHWDGKNPGEWTKVIDGCDLLINLAGKSVNCRYNAANKAKIMASRIDSTTMLGEAVRNAIASPKLWVNGASATIYPHATTMPRDESFTDFANDFSVQVCKNWEAAFNATQSAHTRKVILRMAIVLGGGGVMTPYKRMVKYGLGGRQGSGRQMFSWIHIDDLCRIVEWLWMHPGAKGVYNASAPNPVSNADFMKAVRSSMRMPFGLPAPALLLKTGAALIGTEAELLLKSRWVLPTRLLQEGFRFRFTGIGEALKCL